MDFSLDVDALRRQFVLGPNASGCDLELVPRLFDYLERVAQEKRTCLGQRRILNRRDLGCALGVRSANRWWPPVFTEIVRAADTQLQNQAKLKSIPQRSREVCKRLRRWVRDQIDAKTLPLNRWGYLSIVDMAKAVGCSTSAPAWGRCFRRHVNRINRILEKQPSHPKNNPFYCYVEKHDATYNFEVAKVLDPDLGLRIVKCWEKKWGIQSENTARHEYLATRYFLQFWVNMAASGDGRFGAISRKLMDGVAPDSADMLYVLAEFREHVLTNEKGRKVTKLLHNVNALFDVLNREGVLPKALHLRKPGRDWKKHNPARPKLSLAEVSSSKIAEDELGALVEPLIAERFSKDEIIEVTRLDFLKALVDEGFQVTSSREDHVRHIGDLNRKRLADLRRCAEDELLECWAIYQRGQKLLVECDLSYKEDIEPLVYEWLRLSEKTRGRAIGKARLARLIFDEAEDSDTKIARYLCLCEGRWDGFVPTSSGWELSYFNQRAFLEINGGRRLIASMMQPHRNAYFATMVILLIDTGANVELVRTLPYPCLADRNDPNEKIVGGWKPRAKNDFIQTVIKVNDGNRVSSVNAIEMMEEMTSRLRRMALKGPTGPYENPAFREVKSVGTGAPHNHLFIARGKPGMPMRVPDTATRVTNFKRFLSRHPDLEHLPLKMEHIRSSVLLDVTIRKEGRLVAAQSLADHKSRETTSGYVHKYVQKVLLERSIRKFQTLLEAVLIADISEGHTKLGISKEDFVEALKEAHRTGLGIMCLKPTAGIQKGTIEGSLCDKLENCPSCKSMFIPAIQENIQDMILFNRYLKVKREELENLSPCDWEEIWLPYMVLTDEALARMEKGETSDVYQRALNAVASATFSSPMLTA